jgi:hypothetical protein
LRFIKEGERWGVWEGNFFYWMGEHVQANLDEFRAFETGSWLVLLQNHRMINSYILVDIEIDKLLIDY